MTCIHPYLSIHTSPYDKHVSGFWIATHGASPSHPFSTLSSASKEYPKRILNTGSEPQDLADCLLAVLRSISTTAVQIQP